MHRFSLGLLYLAFAFVLLGPSVAHAQATRTWVSGVGDDVNPCSRTAPCKTFAGAISKTAAGGEINCLDPGGYGTLTITKSISVNCTGTLGSTLNSGGINGFVINDSATGTPGTVVVTLEGLEIEGAGTTPGASGIRFISGASLHVKNVTIRDQNGTGAGHGISFVPNNNAKLIVENVTITNTGAAGGAGGAAILVNPGPGVAAFALISKSHLHRGNFGVVGDSSGGASGINIVVRDTVANGFANTAFLTTGSNIGMMVDQSAATASGTGLSASAGTTIRVGSSIITGNGASVSGNVLSFGDNRINGNGADTIPAPVPGGSH
ncbi:hypothetical protein [Bradyrhizobium sp. BR 10289]|uniref:hypothetical protein n=1 Tax=Bradyrhizobium sp. BR 10289 TaxID=2749993 RepID=UPI001C64A9A6|nr:hypothetical protein [Bradyrhizobium sp. BR 10289]MBW7973501.1 hypothetical protein [Bradyrhizobium sp. BR 10289]